MESTSEKSFDVAHETNIEVLRSEIYRLRELLLKHPEKNPYHQCLELKPFLMHL